MAGAGVGTGAGSAHAEPNVAAVSAAAPSEHHREPSRLVVPAAHGHPDPSSTDLGVSNGGAPASVTHDR